MWKFKIFIVFTVILAFTASEISLNQPEMEYIKDSEDVEKSHGGCNVTITEKKNGSFYPNNATNSTTGFYCYWHITPPKNISDPVCLYFNYLILDLNDEANIYPTVYDAGNETNSLISEPMKAQNGSVTVITGTGDVVVTLKGNYTTFIRNFEVFFSYECISPVPPDVLYLHSPVYAKNVTNARDCLFNFNLIPQSRNVPVFTFEEYSMDNSNVNIEGSDPLVGIYNKNKPTDFFIKDKVMSLTVKPNLNSTDRFLLKIHHVDQRCSFYKQFDGDNPVALKSPHGEFDDGANVVECRWLVKHPNSNVILGLKLDILEFDSVFDIVAVNDGLSEVSSPLLQVTTSNRKYSRTQLIRSGGPYMWISFKPLTYVSNFNASVTVHGQGGHWKNSGNFSMHDTTGDDTAFLLEVEDGKVVQLTFDDFSITSTATVSIYDGFDTSHVLTTLHERANVKFPIFSISSQMMVLATNFSAKTNKFSAKFEGVVPGCNHMNSLSAESYILSENCNSSCKWIIPPVDTSDSELIIGLQYISLKEGDQMDIQLLDKNSTTLAHVTSETKHLPHFAVPVNVGATITVTQAAGKANKTDKVILIGSSSLMPDCKHAVTLKASEKMQISSPLYPDTYPIFSTCQWNLTLPKDSLVHMVFQDFDLAENHCVKIYENGTVNEYSGKVLPDDILLNENAVVEFDSSNCNKTKVGLSLKSGPGFVLNVTVADCGGILDGTKHVFNTSISDNKTSTCIWKVDVTAKDAVNVIIYTVTKKDALKNYELTVYDGSSVRDSEIVNNTNEIWSRSSVLFFVYKRLNVYENSSVLVINYNIMTCKSSMLCENKICMHPDWRCNGINDCGDYTDEENCKSAPVPPEIRTTGYSATAFWMCILAMLIIGIIGGLGIPVCYQKYKDSRYTRFRELNGIDS